MSIKKILLFGSIIWSSIGCTEEFSHVGDYFIQDSHIEAITVDTLSINLSSITLDSTVSDATERLLIGFQQDPFLGTVQSSAYFTLSTNQYIDIESTKTQYLRTVLTLQYDGYSYYDTTAAMDLQIHRVSEPINPATDDRFYNTMSFSYDIDPLAETSVIPYPTSKDTIHITLDSSFGEEIYNLIKQNSRTISNDTDFQQYLHGLTIQSRTNKKGAFIGFTSKAELRIYYQDNSVTPSKEAYVTFTQGNYAFNQLSAHRDNTLLHTLTDTKKTISSDLTNQRAYIQAGVPLAMRVDIPHLRTILLENPNLTLIDATLTFRPTYNSHKPNTNYPLELESSIIDHTNKFLGILSVISKYATLQTDHAMGRDTYYQANVKTYISNELASTSPANGLVFFIKSSEVASTIDRVYVSGENGPNKVRLSLYFVKPQI